MIIKNTFNIYFYPTGLRVYHITVMKNIKYVFNIYPLMFWLFSTRKSYIFCMVMLQNINVNIKSREIVNACFKSILFYNLEQFPNKSHPHSLREKKRTTLEKKVFCVCQSGEVYLYFCFMINIGQLFFHSQCIRSPLISSQHLS